VQTEALEQVLQLDSDPLQGAQTPADRKEPEVQERHSLTELQAVQLAISEAQATQLPSETIRALLMQPLQTEELEQLRQFAMAELQLRHDPAER
jgi:hypothetical protein